MKKFNLCGLLTIHDKTAAPVGVLYYKFSQ
jgi:hypothetical protein